MRGLYLIYAATKNGGIGFNNQIPWSDPEDLANFRKITTGHIIIMGRKTHESIGRILPDRVNIVLSKEYTFEQAMENCCIPEYKDKKVFIIGGASIYNYVLENYSDCIRIVYHTIIDKELKCDTFISSFPIQLIQKSQKLTSINNIITEKYHPNNEELQYKNLIRKILQEGDNRNERTGIGTLSIFDEKLTFDLSNNKIPLLTTKKIFYRGVFEELRWFLLGKSSIKYLQEKGVKIWDDNIKANNDKSGPIYPFQWRSAGAIFKEDDIRHTDGIDQIAEIIHAIKNNPTSRRIILMNWSCRDLKDQALPPCHIMAQFYVQDNKLTCKMTQRSCDVILGLPFNIASYATLTHLIAYITDKKAHKLIVDLGDTHIYKNHIEAAKEHFSRIPYRFPHIKINKKKEEIKDISDIKYENIELYDYVNYGSLINPTPLAV